MNWILSVSVIFAAVVYIILNYQALASRWRALKLIWFYGVIFEDISSVHIDKDVFVGRGTIIHRNVSLHSTPEHRTKIFSNCKIYPGANIFASTIMEGATIWPNVSMYKAFIGKDATVHSHNRIVRSSVMMDSIIDSYCLIKDSGIGANCRIGPHAYIRDRSTICDGAEIANTEVVRSLIKEGAKAKHGIYIGDAVVGKNCNIGAGTVFCNYDGSEKNITVLDDDVFVGSGTMLIAPLYVAKGTFIAAGSVVNHDVKREGTLVIARGQSHEHLILDKAVVAEGQKHIKNKVLRTKKGWHIKRSEK